MGILDETFFWEGVDQGKLLVQKCRDCGTLRHPPLPMCAQCQSLHWDAMALSGKGKIYAWVISKHPSQPDAAARTVVLVDLEEGVRIVSNLEQSTGIEIGMPVEVVFREIDGVRFPQFRPREPNSALEITQ
jgi:hypothetical protein